GLARAGPCRFAPAAGPRPAAGPPAPPPAPADLAGAAVGRRRYLPDHGIDVIAVAPRVVEALQDEAERRIRAVGIMAPEPSAREGRPLVAREIDRTNECRVEFAAPEPIDRDGHRLDPRCLIAGDGEAGSADAERPRDPAGHHAAQRAHRPVRRQSRAGGLASLIDELPIPFAGLAGHR